MIVDLPEEVVQAAANGDPVQLFGRRYVLASDEADSAQAAMARVRQLSSRVQSLAGPMQAAVVCVSDVLRAINGEEA